MLSLTRVLTPTAMCLLFLFFFCCYFLRNERRATPQTAHGFSTAVLNKGNPVLFGPNISKSGNWVSRTILVASIHESRSEELGKSASSQYRALSWPGGRTSSLTSRALSSIQIDAKQLVLFFFIFSFGVVALIWERGQLLASSEVRPIRRTLSELPRLLHTKERISGNK